MRNFPGMNHIWQDSDTEEVYIKLATIGWILADDYYTDGGPVRRDATNMVQPDEIDGMTPQEWVYSTHVMG